MSKHTRPPLPTPPRERDREEMLSQEPMPATCPVCGAMVETVEIGGRTGWSCLSGGYAHYYQARYSHLEGWFTSGEGNLREPVIRAMNCAA